MNNQLRENIVDLAIFDLDNTLLTDDSDYLWGCFLVEQKLVDKQFYQQKNDYFYQQYQKGELNIQEYLQFALQILTRYELTTLNTLHQQFMNEKIIPIIAPKTQQLLDKHRKKNDYLLIITATNLFITAPIADYLYVDDIIAPIPEIKDQRYTGNIIGIPSFQEGKVLRLQDYLQEHPELSMKNSYFYSDSHNDIALLNIVQHPVAVDPDEKLHQYAQQQHWQIISLRH